MPESAVSKLSVKPSPFLHRRRSFPVQTGAAGLTAAAPVLSENKPSVNLEELTIRFVDGAAIRSESLDHQEFGSFATHLQQENHVGMSQTSLERLLARHRAIGLLSSLVLMLAGIYLISI